MLSHLRLSGRPAVIRLLSLLAFAGLLVTPARGEADPAVLETYPIPELDQIVLFVRLPGAADGEIPVLVRSVDGPVVADLRGTVERGAMMLIWDRSGPDGERVPAGEYVAKVEIGPGSGPIEAALRLP